MVVAPNPIQAFTKKFNKVLRDHVWLWFLPTVGMTLAAYAVLRQPKWQATQALLIRDEAGKNQSRLGRFDSVDTMKTAPETILEVARNESVAGAALRTLGRPKRHSKRKPWPGKDDIKDLQDEISVAAPKGAEFGRTEVIYLAVRGDSADEAIRRNKAVCRQLDFQLAKLRQSRAQSLVDELVQTVGLAKAEVDKAGTLLQAMEATVGPDLGELRKLNDAIGGEGNLQHTMT
jgi:succinoglycan biosynthesis transport protein ExoP